MKIDYETLRQKALKFRDDRDWKQFHDPKNLAEGLNIEASELLEHFLWKTCEESRDTSKLPKEKIKEEIGDIFMFIIYLCDSMEIDMFQATSDKIDHNDKKYPVDKARGRREKYTEL